MSEIIIVGNAGGMVKTMADVERFCKSTANRITVGSITKPHRVGNTPVPPGDVYFFDEVTYESGNALGLNNDGMEKYKEILPQMVTLAHSFDKELWASVVGESVEEIVELVLFCFVCGVDGVEINLACPNVHDKGTQKPLFSEDPTLVETILIKLLGHQLKGRQIGVKIHPTRDAVLLHDLCHVFVITNVITEVVCTNTEGGHTFERNGVQMIAFRPPGSDVIKHVGGRAGRPLHELAVWVAGTVRHHLPDYIRVIGVGGIFTGKDAYDFIEVGCAGFQCGTGTIKFGPKILGDVANELSMLLPAEAA